MKYNLAIPASYHASKFVRDLGIKFELIELKAGHNAGENNIYIMAEISFSDDIMIENSASYEDVMGERYELISISGEKNYWLDKLQLVGVTRGMTVTEADKLTRRTQENIRELLRSFDVKIFARV